MNRNRIVGAVEIGTSKVVVLIGEISGQNRLEIIGKSECSSRGITKGEIVDFKAASDCVHSAILQAEQDSGVSLKNVYISQTGCHLDTFYNEGMVNVISPDNIVSKEDVHRVTAEAKGKELAENRLYIHHIRHPFRLDDRVVNEPVGMEGEKLQLGYLCVTGERNKISDQVGIINGIGMQVADMIISPLASGVMVVSPEEKSHGVLVIDMGSGTTDYAVYRNGHVVCCGVVPVGGDHITNDLSLGLRINRKHAERLKIDTGKAFVDSKDVENRVWSVGDKAIGDRHIPVRAIQKIIHARVDELFHIIHKQVSEHVYLKDLSAGAVLTGGASRLAGVDQLAANMLGMSVRRGEHPDWVGRDLLGLEYSTVLGLFYYALTSEETAESGGARKGSLLKKFFNFSR